MVLTAGRPEGEGRMRRFRWMLLGALAVYLYQTSVRSGRPLHLVLPERWRAWRQRLAAFVDERGHRYGSALEGWTHAWSERLRRVNGQSKRIPVEGVD